MFELASLPSSHGLAVFALNAPSLRHLLSPTEQDDTTEGHAAAEGQRHEFTAAQRRSDYDEANDGQSQRPDASITVGQDVAGGEAEEQSRSQQHGLEEGHVLIVAARESCMNDLEAGTVVASWSSNTGHAQWPARGKDKHMEVSLHG